MKGERVEGNPSGFVHHPPNYFSTFAHFKKSIHRDFFTTDS
jgi:hypothetical protein